MAQDYFRDLQPGIIVADNDASSARSICRSLRSYGINALPVFSIRHLLEMLEIEHPNGLILDVALGGVDAGFRAEEYLCEEWEFESRPLVFISSRGGTGLETVCRNRDISLLAKPVAAEHLAGFVRKVRVHAASMPRGPSLLSVLGTLRMHHNVSDREIELLSIALSARQQKTIANYWGVSEPVVSEHVRKVCDRFRSVANDTDVPVDFEEIMRALRRGLVRSTGEQCCVCSWFDRRRSWKKRFAELASTIPDRAVGDLKAEET